MIHIEQIDRTKIEGIEMTESVGAKFAWLIEGSMSMAAYEDDIFIGCGGIAPIEDKWEIWVSLPKKTRVKPFTVARAVYDSFQIMRRSVKEEIISHVVDGFKKGEKMVKFLGFRKNGNQLENDGIIYNEYEL
jgi:hypothetical protein